MNNEVFKKKEGGIKPTASQRGKKRQRACKKQNEQTALVNEIRELNLEAKTSQFHNVTINSNISCSGGFRSDGGSSIAFSRHGFCGVLFPVLSIDGDLDSKFAAVDFFTLQSLESLLLLFLGANINKAVALALPGSTPPLPDNASGDDIETVGREDFGELGVINAKTEIGDEEDGLGGFAGRGFTGGTGDALALRTGGLFLGSSSIAIGGWSFSRSTSDGIDGLLGGLFGLFAQIPLLLGVGGSSSTRGSAFGLVSGFAIGFCFGDLARRCLTAPSPNPPLSPSFGSLLVFLLGGLGDFDNKGAAFKFLLAESGDGLVGSLQGCKGHEAIAGGAVATLDDLGRDDVSRNTLKQSLQTLVSGRVREIASKDLVAWGLLDGLGSGCGVVRDGSGKGVGHDEENVETRGMDSSD